MHFPSLWLVSWGGQGIAKQFHTFTLLWLRRAGRQVAPGSASLQSLFRSQHLLRRRSPGAVSVTAVSKVLFPSLCTYTGRKPDSGRLGVVPGGFVPLCTAGDAAAPAPQEPSAPRRALSPPLLNRGRNSWQRQKTEILRHLFMSLLEKEIETSWCDLKDMVTTAVWFLGTGSPSLLQHHPFPPPRSFTRRWLLTRWRQGWEVNNLGQKDQRKNFVSLKPPRLKADGQLGVSPSRSWKTVDSGVCGRGVKPNPFPDRVHVLLQMWSTHQGNHLRKMQVTGLYFHILNQPEEARGGSRGSVLHLRE